MLHLEVKHDQFGGLGVSTEPVFTPVADPVEQRGKLRAFSIQLLKFRRNCAIDEIGNLVIMNVDIPDENTAARRNQPVEDKLAIPAEQGLEAIIVIFTRTGNNTVPLPKNTVDELLDFMWRNRRRTL